jgi:hypothetical protein
LKIPPNIRNILNIAATFRQYPISYYRKASIIISISVTVILIIDTLASRQILPYDNTSSSYLYILNIIISYGIAPWILIAYINKIIKHITSANAFVKRIVQFTTVTQLLLLILVSLIFVQFLFNISTTFLSRLTFAISTIAASFIMGFIALKFFQWFGSSNRNVAILIYGLASASIAIAMIFDGSAKLLLVQVIEEKSLPSSEGKLNQQQSGELNVTSYDVFIYKYVDKYQGELQYKVVKPQITTLYVVPASIRLLYQYVNGWIPITISFIFTWIITLIVLRQYYERKGKLPLIFYFILILPLVLYFMGRTPEFYTLFSGHIFRFDDMPNPYLFRVLFRIGVIGGSVLFGIAFFVISRSISAGRVKDCVTIAAIGATMIGISLSPSALQNTFGVAGRSLMLSSSFLFSLGFYLSAVHIAQDLSLRKYFRRTNKIDLLDSLGNAQMESEIEKTVRKVLRDQQQILNEQSGIAISTSGDNHDVKLYVNEVLEEVKKIR